LYISIIEITPFQKQAATKIVKGNLGSGIIQGIDIAGLWLRPDHNKSSERR
jgi:hypothetical protein